MIAFAVNTTYQNHIMITGGNVYFYSMKKSQRMMVHTYLKRVYDIAQSHDPYRSIFACKNGRIF